LAGLEPIVDLAPGAEDNALAVEMADRIRENVRWPPAARDFAALRSSVLMVAQDLCESFTLRFDHGRLTVHDGGVGIPSVTFCGDADALRRLSDFPLSRLLKIPRFGPFSAEGRTTWGLLANLYVSDFKVYGLVAHPRTVVYLLRLLSSGRSRPGLGSPDDGFAARNSPHRGFAPGNSSRT
jgi:hypothetical protein